MNISIRQHILNNFNDADEKEIKKSIEQSINDKDEITLPGLGVFFEILWSSSTDNDREKIIDILFKNLKGKC